jgi:hypothetical protein
LILVERHGLRQLDERTRDSEGRIGLRVRDRFEPLTEQRSARAILQPLDLVRPHIRADEIAGS